MKNNNNKLQILYKYCTNIICANILITNQEIGKLRDEVYGLKRSVEYTENNLEAKVNETSNEVKKVEENRKGCKLS